MKYKWTLQETRGKCGRINFPKVVSMIFLAPEGLTGTWHSLSKAELKSLPFDSGGTFWTVSTGEVKQK